MPFIFWNFEPREPFTGVFFAGYLDRQALVSIADLADCAFFFAGFSLLLPVSLQTIFFVVCDDRGVFFAAVLLLFFFVGIIAPVMNFITLTEHFLLRQDS